MTTILAETMDQSVVKDFNVPPVLEMKNLSVAYEGTLAVKNVSLIIPERCVTAFIGPSGCGKSSVLRSINRMNDLVDGATVSGSILFRGIEIYDKTTNVTELRQRIGLVFQRSNPFPKSIYENVAFGLRLQGEKNTEVLDTTVEESLSLASLWNEVKDRLDENALSLSGGQQQRLCIARAIATQPDVLLMDEPCSALDPIATGKIEDLINTLKERYTILIVTHNMQQAARISDYTGFMLHGELVEFGETGAIFHKPSCKETDSYIRGRFG